MENYMHTRPNINYLIRRVKKLIKPATASLLHQSPKHYKRIKGNVV